MVITPDSQPYIQTIDGWWYNNQVAEVAMLRLDIIHAEVSGNKWYKLKHNINYCQKQGVNSILTFGGAYSNHLAATAAMAQMSGLRSIGIVKGKYAEANPTPTLLSCINNGMQLVYVTNEEYRQKNDKGYLLVLAERFDNPLIIPEGGANALGRVGAEEIVSLIPERFTHIAVPVGTGTTLIGIVNSCNDDVAVIGFAPMKGGAYLNAEVKPYLKSNRADSYHIYDDWHFGGFGKHNEELISFMNQFYIQHNIPLDKVYTAKMMYGLKAQIEQGLYPQDVKILCIHTGGLQGNQSLSGQLQY